MGARGGCGKGSGKVVGGAAPERMRERGTPPAQLGGVGEPTGVWGGALEAIAFCIESPSKST